MFGYDTRRIAKKSRGSQLEMVTEFGFSFIYKVEPERDKQGDGFTEKSVRPPLLTLESSGKKQKRN